MSFKQIKLGDVIKHRKGFITIDDNKEYKLCRVQLHRRGVLLREVVKGSTIRTKKQQVCKAGDFLVAEMDAKVGGYGFVPEELEGAIVSSHYFLFELDESKIRPKYLEVISRLLILQDQIKAVGSTNYAAIRPANVLNWDIPITNINKQKEIEKLFDSTRAIGNSLSNEFSNQQDLLTQLRQSFLREAMQGKLVKQDPKDGHAKDLLHKIKAEKAKSGRKERELPPITPEEIPFEIPENWVWCRGEIVAKYIDPQPSHRTPPVSSDGVPYIAMSDINSEGKIDFNSARKVGNQILKEHRERYTLEKGDFIFGKIGTIGKPVYLPEPFIYTLSANVILIQPVREIVYDKYLFYFLSSSIAEKELKDKKSTTSYPVFGMGKARNMLITLPPLKEQHRIVKKLDELMALCDELLKSMQASRKQNELLLQQVLKEALLPDR